jgi:hypothetical protein
MTARLFDLQNASLSDLARTVVDLTQTTQVRYKAYSALKSRLPELNGVGWARMDQDDMKLINQALDAEFCDACVVSGN